MSYKSVRSSFKAYVSRIVSAKHFLENPRSIAFYFSLSPVRRKKLKERLQSVDPDGLQELRRRWASLLGHARKLRNIRDRGGLSASESRTKEMAIVQTKLQEQGVPGEVRVISLEGFKRLLSTALAVYRPEEVAAFAGMELGSLNSLVTVEDVAAVRKMVPEAIRHLADRVVLRDLSQGTVTPQTEIADRISARRIKSAIDLHAEQRETDKDDEILQKQREKELRERFRVDRHTGVKIGG